MADSLNTTTPNLSRRAAMASSLAALSLLPVAAKAAVTLTKDQGDAELLALSREHERLAALQRKAFEASDRANEIVKAQQEPIPEAAHARPEDRALGLPKPYGFRGQYDCYAPSDIEAFEERPRTQSVEIPIRVDDHTPFAPGEEIGEFMRDREILVKRVPWSEAQARVDEIVSTFRAWKIRDHALHEAAGAYAAQKAIDALYDEMLPFEEAIIAMPATTLAGLVAKAKLVSWCCNGDVSEEEHSGDTTDVQVAYSLIRDLLALDRPRGADAAA